MKRTLAIVALVGMIPLAGWLVGSFIQWRLEKQWTEVVYRELGESGLEGIKSGRFALLRYCETPEGRNEGACGTYKSVLLLQNASIAAALAGFVLLLATVVAARLASSNRNLLVTLFAPGLNVVLFTLFALIIVQGVIATYSAYIFEVSLIQRVHFVIIGGIGIGALIGAIKMINAGFSISRRARSGVIGQAVNQNEQPRLWEFVTTIAQKLGAQPPRQIVLGLDPNFYVTSADVTVMPSGATHSDQTMYLSLPLMRLLSHEELAAVVGHELGHFRGEDTKFSLRFYPIYAGTSQALMALHTDGEGSSTLALLPARAMLSFFLEEFAKAERGIGRERELEADRAGASVATARAMGTALLKIGALGPIWPTVQEGVVEALSQGSPQRNISEFYVQTALSLAKSEVLDEVADQATTHPTDTHPPTIQRINALELDFQDIKARVLTQDALAPASQLLDAGEVLEESLTAVVQRILGEQGVQPASLEPAADEEEPAERRAMGLCLNCEEKIPAESETCPNCNVSFGTGSDWKIKQIPGS